MVPGAGLDSRAYRGELLRAPVEAFEVDHPATQANKIERMQRYKSFTGATESCTMADVYAIVHAEV